MANLATRSKPDGGAMPSVVEKFVNSALQESRERAVGLQSVLEQRLAVLAEMPGGYDFAEVLKAYWKGHDSGDDQLKSDAVRWLRAEFSTRTDARRALGVRTIIDDENVYDQLKLFAQFVRLAGYSGLLLCMDEMVNLYKLANTRARSSNYEQILRILNDSLQGAAVGLGILFGGTPEFLMDPRRGLYSYEALHSRLVQNRFATDGLRDLSGPVLHLSSLTQEELYVLLHNLRRVFASGQTARAALPDEALVAFMEHCSKRIGDAYFRTPRNTIRAFLDLLAVLEQNSAADWRQLLGGIQLHEEKNPDLEPLAAEDDGEGEAQGSADDEEDLSAFKI